MIAVKDAKDLIFEHAHANAESETISLQVAAHRTLALNVLSEINSPPFRQSAMDGYALRIGEGLSYKVIGEIKAGDSDNPELHTGEAVRIFTGAAVPDLANAVVIQERVEVNENIITLSQQPIPQMNVRPLGEQVKKGAAALEKGKILTPAAIGFLAGLGITEVSVFKKPSVAILATGNELLAPGEQLTHGKIYESNAIMLKTALQSKHYNDVKIYKVADNYNDTVAILERVIRNAEVVLITGGISVGDYDYVGKALLEIGVNQIFYKVKQKPGKPLFFGNYKNTSIFALPGNPAAALTCFYNYALPLLNISEGKVNPGLQTIRLKSLSKFEKKGERAQFLKASMSEDGVSILEGQSSAMLYTFAEANALVFMDETQMNINKGDLVQTIILPQ